ncbi:nitroreductase/quinone reductase family protein [Terrabacter sp. 2YAF2]|uniref:nitroreductase/quinone reductase family protein n=1 Tax=Terrabacter sp. 2YAF2 TaxID=3233026 RepID=UPI003F9B6C12
MAYLKPPALTRHLANPLAMRLGGRGVATLTVTGRRTGQPRRVPVIPVDVGEKRYRHSVDGCFAQMPAPKDHPVFQIGQVH